MIDRDELVPHFEWLDGSEYYDEVLGEAVLAIELCAAHHGREWMRYGGAEMSAAGVVEVLALDPFVDRVREARAAGRDLCLESVAEHCRRSLEAARRAGRGDLDGDPTDRAQGATDHARPND